MHCSCQPTVLAWNAFFLTTLEEQVVVKKTLWSRRCGMSDCKNERENLQEDLQLHGSVFGVAVQARQAATCLKKKI